MVIYFVIVALFGSLLLLSSRTELPKELQQENLKKPFLKVAWFLMRKHNDIQTVQKFGEAMLVLFVGLGLTLLAQLFTVGNHNLMNGYELNRPGKGQGERVQELQVQFEDEEQTEQLEIVLQERSYTTKERRELLKMAMKELEATILGDNTSVDEVRERIILPEKAAGGEVSIWWMMKPIGLVDEDGYITEDLPEEGEILQLQAELTCGSERGIFSCALHLLPPLYSPGEALSRAIQKSVKDADQKSAEEDVLRLPREIDGRTVTWSEPETSVLETGLGLAFAAALAVWVIKSREQQERREKRRRQLLIDYPTLLFKMSMLLNAGLTIQNAFVKIALEYRENHKADRFAYEEMLVSYREMQSGVSEAHAYENFGRRCGEASYLKLGTLLSGNLQKGSEGLAKLLQEEALYSMEERRQIAKRLGEEAGTKLLLPMLLMLVVVLIIMLVPAMMSF